MLVALREGRVLCNLLKDLEHARVSCFDIISGSTVVWVDPRVAIRVDVYDELIGFCWFQ